MEYGTARWGCPALAAGLDAGWQVGLAL